MQYLYSKNTTYSTLITSIAALTIAIIALMFIVWQFSFSLLSSLPEFQEMGVSEQTLEMIQDRINEMIVFRDFLFGVFMILITIVIIIGVSLMHNLYIVTNLLNKEKGISIKEIKKSIKLEKSFSVKAYRFNQWLSNIRKK
jgi:hypothetical protein